MARPHENFSRASERCQKALHLLSQEPGQGKFSNDWLEAWKREEAEGGECVRLRMWVMRQQSDKAVGTQGVTWMGKAAYSKPATSDMISQLSRAT